MFSLFQFNRTQRLKKAEKINKILQEAFELRRASQDLRHLIERTDDIDSHETFLDTIDSYSEELFSKVLNNKKTNISGVYNLEQGLLEIRLQFDLLEKQIHEQIRFNDECAEFDEQKNIS